MSCMSTKKKPKRWKRVFSRMTLEEKERELLRLADVIGIGRARQIVRNMITEEEGRHLSVN